MGTYEVAVHFRLHGIIGGFRPGSNFNGTLMIDERGICTASHEDGTVFAQAPASDVDAEYPPWARGATDPSALRLRFPGSDSVIVNFGPGTSYVAGITAVPGREERERFLEVLQSPDDG
jgi:hypothetical protein